MFLVWSDMHMKSGIYKIEAHERIYIGQSTDVIKRFVQHRYQLRKGTHNNDKLQHDWNLYGESAFTFSVVEYCDALNLNQREQFWIDTTRATVPEMYNVAPLANSQIGVKRSKETKALISKARKGFKHTDESKELMSKAKTGTKHTDETKRKVGNAKAKEWCFLSPDGNVHRFKNLREFCRMHDLTPSNMAAVYHGKGRLKSHKGWSALPVEPLPVRF